MSTKHSNPERLPTSLARIDTTSLPVGNGTTMSPCTSLSRTPTVKESPTVTLILERDDASPVHCRPVADDDIVIESKLRLSEIAAIFAEDLNTASGLGAVKTVREGRAHVEKSLLDPEGEWGQTFAQLGTSVCVTQSGARSVEDTTEAGDTVISVGAMLDACRLKTEEFVKSLDS